MRLQIGEGLFRETFATLSRCGDGRRECVVYWSGPVERPHIVDGLLHPSHLARPDYYEADSGWLHRCWLRLGRERRAIRAQIHTHGGVAFHSRTDDGYPVVQTAGFISIVIPHFAKQGASLDGAFCAELDQCGAWRGLEPAECVVVT